MKRALILLTLAACGAPQTATGRAPDFRLDDPAGKPHDGSALWSDQPVLLVFMTSWCGPCRAEVPHVNQISKNHRVVAIATGDKATDILRFRAETGAMYPILLDDGKVAGAFGIRGTPTFVLVDRGGSILYRGNEPPGSLQ